MKGLKKYEGFIDKAILFGLSMLIFGLPFSNSIIEIAAVGVICLWLFKKIFILRSYKLEYTPLNIPIFAYFAFVLFSLFNSRYLALSLMSVFSKTLEYILIFFVVSESVRTPKDLRKIVSVLFFSCLLIGADGLWQYFTGYDFLRGYGLYSLKRPTASLEFPNSFANWLVTVAPLCVSLAVFRMKENLYRRAGALLGILLFASLVLTLNRGAILSFIPAVLFIAAKRGGAFKKTIIALLAVTVLLFGISAFLEGDAGVLRYVLRPSSVSHRITLAKACVRMFLDRPFFGHGINTFMGIYGDYMNTSNFSVSYAHNCYLQIMVETGIFGLLAFLWIILAFFRSSMKDINRRKDGFIKASQIGLSAGLMAYLFHSAADTTLYSLKLAVLFYYFLGLAAAVLKMEEE